MVYEVEVMYVKKPCTYTFIVVQDSEKSSLYQEWLELFQTLTGDEKYYYLACHYRLLYQQLTGDNLIPFQEDMDVDISSEPFMVKQPATAILLILEDLVQGSLEDEHAEIPAKHIRRLKRWYRNLEEDEDLYCL
jgi:hypothetical protein